MVKLCENSEPAFEQVRRARFVRRRPYGKQRVAPNVALLLIRARYYDPMTGEFTSRDPLEYVDGMSLYRAYFGLGGVDPSGLSPCGDIYNACMRESNENTDIEGKWAREAICKRKLEKCENSVANTQREILLGMLQAACNACPDEECEEGQNTECTKQQCLKDAEAISLAIFYTIRGRERRVNWRFPKFPWVTEHRRWGWYCSRWAHGFDDAVNNINSSCFSSKANGKFKYPYGEGGSYEEHVWIEITSTCSNTVVAYIDDSFGSGTTGCTSGDWIHPVAPDCNWTNDGSFSKPGEQGCNVPAYGPDGKPIK